MTNSTQISYRLIRAALERHMERLILANTISEMDFALKDMFSSGYEAVASAFFAAFPPRDLDEYRRDLRHSIPVAALNHLESAILDEPLLSVNFRPHLMNAINIVRSRIAAIIPPQSQTGVPNTDASVVLSALLHDELVRLALRHSLKWKEPEPDIMALIAARKERLERFQSDVKQQFGREASKGEIAKAAGVDRRDVNKYLEGRHKADSVLTDRITGVLSGKRPIIFFPRGKVGSSAIQGAQVPRNVKV